MHDEGSFSMSLKSENTLAFVNETTIAVIDVFESTKKPRQLESVN